MPTLLRPHARLVVQTTKTVGIRTEYTPVLNALKYAFFQSAFGSTLHESLIRITSPPFQPSPSLPDRGQKSPVFPTIVQLASVEVGLTPLHLRCCIRLCSTPKVSGFFPAVSWYLFCARPFWPDAKLGSPLVVTKLILKEVTRLLADLASQDVCRWNFHLGGVYASSHTPSSATQSTRHGSTPRASQTAMSSDSVTSPTASAASTSCVRHSADCSFSSHTQCPMACPMACVSRPTASLSWFYFYKVPVWLHLYLWDFDFDNISTFFRISFPFFSAAYFGVLKSSLFDQ